MSQLLRRKTRSRKTSLDVEGRQISEEKQSLGGAAKSCSVNVMDEKENPENQLVTENPTALVIDDIIDDFDLVDELKEESAMDSDNVDQSGTLVNGVKSSEQSSEKEQDSDCYTDDIEEEEEEMEEEVNDDEEYVQPNANKGNTLLGDIIILSNEGEVSPKKEKDV